MADEKKPWTMFGYNKREDFEAALNDAERLGYMRGRDEIDRLAEENTALRQGIEVWQRDAGSAYAREDENKEMVKRLRAALRDSRDYVEAGATGYCFNHLDVKEAVARIDALLTAKPTEERMPDPIKVVTCPECGHPYAVLPDTKDADDD